MTTTEWWKQVDDRWADLVNAIETFHPNRRNWRDPINVEEAIKQLEEDSRFPITSPGAEIACEVVRKTIDTQTPVTVATKAKEDRDIGMLMRIFNEAWFGAPESRSVYSVPGFGLMCDLLSDPPDDLPDYEETE